MKRLLVALAALAALSGCGVAAAHQVPLPSSAPTSAATAESHTPGRAAPEVEPPAVPTRLRLGAIDAPIVPLSLTGSALTPPEDPRTLGWWGKRAGSPHGTTLLTGHTVHDGGGTFDDLEHTPLGARAHLDGHSYRVASVEVISKERLAQRAEGLFAQGGSHKLVLVTCEDYDRATRHYASNVVVILKPAR